MNRLWGWLNTTMKDNKTIEIDFLKNKPKTMTTVVLVGQSANTFILGRFKESYMDVGSVSVNDCVELHQKQESLGCPTLYYMKM